MTTPASFPTTARPRNNQGRFNPPKNLGFGFIPATAISVALSQMDILTRNTTLN